MTIDQVGFKIAAGKQILTVGRDYLIVQHGKIEAVNFIGIRVASMKYGRDHFIIKSYRTGRVRILKSAGHFV